MGRTFGYMPLKVIMEFIENEYMKMEKAIIWPKATYIGWRHKNRSLAIVSQKVPKNKTGETFND